MKSWKLGVRSLKAFLILCFLLSSVAFADEKKSDEDYCVKDIYEEIQKDNTIPLKELVTMINPVHKDFKNLREGKEIDKTKNPDKHKFYCEAYALFEYVYSTFETDFVSKLITSLKEGKTFENFIKSYSEKNKECSTTIDELEKKWKEWVTKRVEE